MTQFSHFTDEQITKQREIWEDTLTYLDQELRQLRKQEQMYIDAISDLDFEMEIRRKTVEGTK